MQLPSRTSIISVIWNVNVFPFLTCIHLPDNCSALFTFPSLNYSLTFQLTWTAQSDQFNPPISSIFSLSVRCNTHINQFVFHCSPDTDFFFSCNQSNHFAYRPHFNFVIRCSLGVLIQLVYVFLVTIRIQTSRVYFTHVYLSGSVIFTSSHTLFIYT